MNTHLRYRYVFFPLGVLSMLGCVAQSTSLPIAVNTRVPCSV
jgi:hypothetical protein